MTGQSLFYMGETDLKHKLLADRRGGRGEPRELCVETPAERGRAHDRLDVKDATTGKLVTQEYRVEGPVMIVLTTTAAEIDEELLNRCLVLSVDESRAQTQAIHAGSASGGPSRARDGSTPSAKRPQARTRTRSGCSSRSAVVNPYADRYLPR